MAKSARPELLLTLTEKGFFASLPGAGCGRRGFKVFCASKIKIKYLKCITSKRHLGSKFIVILQ